MTVVDASVVVQALSDPAGPEAEALIGAGQLLGPAHLELEVAETMRHRHANRRLSREGSSRMMERFQELGIERRDEPGLLPRIWELTVNLTAYDACYVALAERLGVPFLTADARITRAPGLRCEVQLPTP